MSDPIIIPVAPQALSVRIINDEQAMSAGINPAVFRGKNAYLHIRYAPNGSPMDDEIGTIPNEYIGLCTNDNPEAPTTADSYVWIHISHQSAEDARVAAEQARAAAEQDRTTAESARVAAESDRASAEQGRVTAEAARETAEAARETAEAAREAAPKYLHIRYAAVENPGDGQILTTPNDYIGTAVTANSVAPTSASAYQWARFRGHDGTGSGNMHTDQWDPDGDGLMGIDKINGLRGALDGKATTQQLAEQSEAVTQQLAAQDQAITQQLAAQDQAVDNALAALQPKLVTADYVLLGGDAWTASEHPDGAWQQAVDVPGMTAQRRCAVSYAPGHRTAYEEAGVAAIDNDEDGTVLFVCREKPTVDIAVRIEPR